MPPSTKPEAYAYARELMDRALLSPAGLEITLESPRNAERTRWDCYNARRVDQRVSQETHSPEDPEYGHSIYDNLRFSVRKGSSLLRIEHQSQQPVKILNIQELGKEL